MIDDPTSPGPGPDAATVDASPGSGSTAVLPTAAGDRFGRFRVEGMLGAGGMGVVFAAHDPLLDRQVAIKVMAQSADDTDGVAAEARMVREAKAMARLTHPNVVRVYEAGATRAGVFLVMELIEGTTLARWLDEPRPWREVLATGEAALLSLGVTRQKARYVVGLAAQLESGAVSLERVARMPDAAAGATLVQIPGIGPWTAGVYLLMALRRPDVWPPGDLGLHKSMAEIRGLSAVPTSDAAAAFAMRWRPWRAVAARLLWHSYLSRREAGSTGKDSTVVAGP